jgi:integrase
MNMFGAQFGARLDFRAYKTGQFCKEYEEVKQLRTVTQAGAIVDMKLGRVRGLLAYMVIYLALSTGLRASEMAALKIMDSDFKHGAISDVRLKHKKKKKREWLLAKRLSNI